MAMPSYVELKDKFIQICEMNDSAHSIALGAAIGILIGFQPCMGIQMTIAIPLAFILRANKLLAAAGVWFTNPVTFIPIYYSAYITGTWVYPVESISLSEFTELMNNFTTKMLMQLGEKTVIPLIIGCLILGFISASLTYFLVLFMVKKTRKKQSQDEPHTEDSP
jgi:hypothetical protein